MEKSAYQRLQAVIALMVGAFTFGVYASSFESRMSAFDASRTVDAMALTREVTTNKNQQVIINRNEKDIQMLGFQINSLNP